MEWQLLGNEPKDGTFFLIAGEWDGDPGNWCISIGTYKEVNSLSPEREMWIGREKAKDKPHTFTHWMPLPAPPAGKHV